MLHWLNDIIGLTADCVTAIMTPLNAVSMSLSLIQTELANLIGLDTSIQEMDQHSPVELECLFATSSHSDHDDNSPGKKKTIECLCLIQDTQSHLQSAVDVASLQNCWQVPGHCHLLTDTTSTSTCQTSLTSLQNTRGTGFSM